MGRPPVLRNISEIAGVLEISCDKVSELMKEASIEPHSTKGSAKYFTSAQVRSLQKLLIQKNKLKNQSGKSNPAPEANG